MPEGRAPWRRLVLLALVVLALHLWLMGAGPRLVQPTARATPWTARTIAETPPPPPPAPVAAALVVAPVAAAPLRRPANPAPQQPLQAPEIPATPVAVTPPPPPPPPSPAATVVQTQPYVLPPAARIRYKLAAQSRGITLGGEGELTWKHDGQKYEAQLKASAPLLPTRTQTSTGSVTAEGLAPKRFSDKSRNEEAAHFEHESGKVVFSSNRPEAALQPGAQDRLSVLLQLGAMIAGAPHKFPPGTSIAIQTASTREAEPWTFLIDGMQTLDLPGGTVEALKLTRQPQREYDAKVELWLAPGMAYVPVRLRLTQRNGDWVDQQWSSTDRS